MLFGSDALVADENDGFDVVSGMAGAAGMLW